MACLREPCPFTSMLNQSAFVHPDPVHLWMAAKKKKLTHPLPEAGHSRGHLQILWPFYFTSSSPPLLYSIKETGIQTPIRWFIRDTRLPSCLPAFRIKSYFLLQHLVSDSLACRVVSRASLDSVTHAYSWRGLSRGEFSIELGQRLRQSSFSWLKSWGSAKISIIIP